MSSIGDRGGESEGRLARIALRFTAWSEKWIPDAFVIALVATVIVFLAGLSVSGPIELVDAWGQGFWELLKFTMQMVLILVAGYVVASARPVHRAIVRLASWPAAPRVAIVMVAIFSMLSSWLNWGFSLIFSALLAREVARRVRGVDYRVLAAATLLGVGSIWAQGLSGSAALQMASAGALSPKIRDIVNHGGLVPGGVIDFSHTIFLWQSLAAVAIEIVVVSTLFWFMTPVGAGARTVEDLGITLAPPPDDEPEEGPTRPGDYLEHTRWMMMPFIALGAIYAVRSYRAAGGGAAAITLDLILLVLLLLGAALHGTPARLMRAVKDATPATWPLILQYPFYAGIAGMIAHTPLSEKIAHMFVGVASHDTLPPILGAYSAVLGIFVPSGGGKWIIEAPYVMESAHALKVHLGWMVAVYDLGEAVANLLQPFWMLPTLALLGLRARDVMGFTFVVFLVLFPLVLLLTWLLGMTLPYPL